MEPRAERQELRNINYAVVYKSGLLTFIKSLIA
jgi:hypothetical protein